MSGERQDSEGVVRRERHPGWDLLFASEADPGSGIDGGTAGIPADSKAIGGDPNHIRRDQRQSSGGSKPGTTRRNRQGFEVMLKEFAENGAVYLVTGYTDLRRGIDGLAGTVQGNLSLDPFSRSLFLFCGRRCDRIKGLLWEGDGFLLLYKRLDNGSFRWPRTETEAKLLTPQEIRWLLEGLELEQPKAIKPGKAGTFL